MPAQLAEQLFQIGQRNILALADGGQGDRPAVLTQRQIDLWLTPEAEATIMASQCLKRKLYPEDIARPVLFFASDEAGACTNQSYVVDGGWV